ncbi:MAG: hypothetical protein IMF15_09360 [Proteobacteria bacterium]|nr:hypothetical protein [Pseudomonadota bacterium]
MKIPLSVFIRLSIFLVCTFALHKMMPVISRQWQGIEACPALGPLPVCYLVFACYSIIAVSVILAPTRTGWMFLLGWLPVFLLALSGTLLELMGQPTCPRTNLDIPLCFFSLAIACVLFAGFILIRKISTQTYLEAP